MLAPKRLYSILEKMNPILLSLATWATARQITVPDEVMQKSMANYIRKDPTGKRAEFWASAYVKVGPIYVGQTHGPNSPEDTAKALKDTLIFLKTIYTDWEYARTVSTLTDQLRARDKHVDNSSPMYAVLTAEEEFISGNPGSTGPALKYVRTEPRNG